MPEQPGPPAEWGGSSFPPPGSPPPPPGGPVPPTSTPPGGYPSYAPQQGQGQGGQPAPDPRWTPPGMHGAVHKPGAMALRPLGLGDIYDAAFRIIRFNPKATVGSAVLVATVAMAIPLLLTGVLTFTVGLTYDATSTTVDTDDLAGLVASFGALAFGTVLQAIGLIFVTGMVAHVAAAAAIGKRLSLGEAWAATAGKRWRLVGLSLLLGLVLTVAVTLYVVLWVVVALSAPAVAIVVWGVVTVPAFVAALWWFWIRVYYLPVPALMLEQVGIAGAVARGYRLTAGQFWRTFGIALLTVVLVNVAGGILSFPISLVGQVGVLAVDEGNALLLLIATQGLATVVSTAFVAPFTAAVTSLQYLDARIRKEAYDVELMRQAGVLR
jgi:hypothetical protein